ncbi:PH domain-containing protein [Aliidiomarina sanyensis]|uniref:YdbS-like PH domain-containing protein n=1 Tax=Aliidiomarina sanyensis TaxID=1249555 RepID=A0A432WKD3_9GAMM|nr:PH domain-containing protein [Aliidiomarina sanyensis]RUO34218.1 hypothetical protein CWE11_05680 [Aliidiomarina sanyensis]
MQEPNWQAVSPKYTHLLRIDKTLFVLMLVIPLTVAVVFVERIPLWVGYIGWGSLLLIWLGMVFLWAPRRYRVTAYAVLPEEVHFRVGALWLRHTAVTHNRIQHLEIEQSPFERLLGLSRLIIFTAGGSGADLILPGLPVDRATSLRDDLLKIIREEPQLDEPITVAGKTESAESQRDTGTSL